MSEQIEVRGQIGNPGVLAPICSCCHQRKESVGAFSDAEGQEFCQECGVKCSTPCGRTGSATA